MAVVNIAINRGETEFDITRAGATQGKDVEVEFEDSASSLRKEEVIRLLDMIRNDLVKGDDFK